MKPTILILHGAWHVPQHYKLFVERLKTAGFDVALPHLPTCGELAVRSTLADDAKVIHDELEDLIVKNSRQVIVVAHSYGGAVAAEALVERDSDSAILHTTRQAQGLRGGVLHLIYMCGFMLQVGESTASASLPRPDPDPVDLGAGDGTSFLSQPGRTLFYADVDDEALVRHCEGLLAKHNFGAQTTPSTHPVWKYLPTTYLKCTRDVVLFPEWQERLIAAVEASGTKIEVRTYDASHSPFLSMPGEMVSAIEDVAQRYQ